MQDLHISKDTALWVETYKRLQDLESAYCKAMSEQYGNGEETDKDFNDNFMPAYETLRELIRNKIGFAISQDLDK